MLALELGTRTDPRWRLGGRRVHPEGLLDGSHKVGEAGSRLHVDLGLAVKGSADLADKHVVHGAVLLQSEVESESRHGGGRCLAASCHERGRVHEDIEVVETRLSVARLLEHVGHEVPAAAGALALSFAGHGFLVGELAILDLLL